MLLFSELSLINSHTWMSLLVAKIENVIINSKWMHEIMAGQKEKPGYSEETPWFPEYYIGWIGISNSGQKISSVQPMSKCFSHKHGQPHIACARTQARHSFFVRIIVSTDLWCFLQLHDCHCPRSLTPWKRCLKQTWQWLPQYCPRI